MDHRVDCPAHSTERAVRTSCSKCQRELDASEFARDASKASGRKSYCKTCDNAKAKTYYRSRLAPAKRDDLPIHLCECGCIVLGAQRRCTPCAHFSIMLKRGRDAEQYRRRSDEYFAKKRERAALKLRPCATCDQQWECTEATWYARDKQCHTCKPITRTAYEPPTWIATTLTSCRWCDTTFMGAGSYCSDQCRSDVKRHMDKVYNKGKTKTDPRCECGAPLPSTKRRKCESCLRVSRSEAKRRERRTRRARLRQIPTDNYTMALIAERDEYTCALCNKAVDMTLLVPHADAPTIDHIIPIALGGHDTTYNVQLAHFMCNVRKGANRLC